MLVRRLKKFLFDELGKEPIFCFSVDVLYRTQVLMYEVERSTRDTLQLIFVSDFLDTKRTRRRLVAITIPYTYKFPFVWLICSKRNRLSVEGKEGRARNFPFRLYLLPCRCTSVGKRRKNDRSVRFSGDFFSSNSHPSRWRLLVLIESDFLSRGSKINRSD